MKKFLLLLLLIPSLSLGASSFVLDGFTNGSNINATGRLWFTASWTSVNSAQVTPSYAFVNNQSLIVSTDQYITSPYSAKCTGYFSVNGPTTYAGFLLGTELSPSYCDLTWMQSVSFSVMTSAACTLRMNFNNPQIQYGPVTWNGGPIGGNGNDDQYGYTFTISTPSAWTTIGIDYSALSCQDWGSNSCPLTLSDGTTMSLSRALSQITSLQWQTESATLSTAVSLTFWVDNIVMTSKSGYTAPTMFKPKTTFPMWWK